MPKLVPREIAYSLALSVKEACEFSSLGTTLYKLMKSGKITARKCEEPHDYFVGRVRTGAQVPRVQGGRDEHEETEGQARNP